MQIKSLLLPRKTVVCTHVFTDRIYNLAPATGGGDHFGWESNRRPGGK